MITISNRPKDYSPAFNSLMFEFTSDQTAQPNFFYYILCTDELTGFTQVYKKPVEQGSFQYFDASVFAADFIESELRPTTGNPLSYGFKTYNLVRPITVNIGESYDGSPEIHSGTDEVVNVWNASLYKRDFFTYQEAEWIFELGSPAILSSLVDEDVYEDYSTFIHLINKGSSGFVGLKIESLSNTGSVLQTSYIPNPYYGESPVEHEYLCIDVGVRSLSLINSGLVTGTYPPLAANAYAYNVYVGDSDSPSVYTLKKTYTIKTCSNFDVYVIHYLARSGAFDTIVFDKNTYRSIDVTKEEFDQYYYQQANISNNENSQAFGVTKQTNVVEEETLNLNTGWITADQRAKYAELISSTLCYWDRGTDGMLEVRPTKRSWDVTKRVKGKKENLFCEFKIASKESRQR